MLVSKEQNMTLINSGLRLTLLVEMDFTNSPCSSSPCTLLLALPGLALIAGGNGEVAYWKCANHSHSISQCKPH